ncbi:UDP-galactopyranose mutase [soil metagenome]
MTYDYLIVGVGFTGAVLAERIASQLDQKVLLIDRRDHIAGNAFDCLDPHGIRIHKYGPHLFHTNSDKVWRYLSRFTEWQPYEHRVLAQISGQLVPVPFNLTSLQTLFPAAEAQRLETLLVKGFGRGANVPILKLREAAAADAAATELAPLADYVYDNVFHGYTVKQWGLTPEELGPAVMSRVPVRISHDDRYFQDQYQALPRDGYTAMVRRILDHPNIEVALGTDFAVVANDLSFDRLIYTGPIDAYFEHRHGALPYRSLRFDFEHLPETEYFQAATQVNYPNSEAYTRITEFKHATGQQATGTTISREYPEAYTVGQNEPYYPIPLPEHRALLARYQKDAYQLNTVTFAGRLADYRYYNMDQAVAHALTVFERGLSGSS